MLGVESTWKHGSDEFVYRYCSWEVAKNYVLSGPKTHRFSDISSMNDPLEFEHFNIPLYGVPKNTGFPQRYWKLINQVTKVGVRYFCCSQDVISDYNSETGYLSTESIRGFAHPSMWNHYASKHEGVCLILNKSALNSAIKDHLPAGGCVYSGSINYATEFNLEFHKNIFPIIEGMGHWTDKELVDYLRVQMEKNTSLLFFTKNLEWRVENEFRWAYVGKGTDYIDIPIGDSLVGMILGCDFNNEFHNDAARLADDNGIPVRRIWWQNGFPCPPWPINEFESGNTLAKWGEKAAIRRASRHV